MSMLYRVVILSICIVYAGVASAADLKSKVEALGFKPHKALYDIRLAGVHSGSQIVNISGQMLYEWQPSCDAWGSNHRYNITYEYADAAPMKITSNFATYEPFDGQMLSFTSQRKRNGSLFEEIRGQADMQENAAGEAVFTRPENLTFDLPEGTLFPMAHSVAVAEKIKAGKTFYQADMFDGSDEDGPVIVNTFIGGPVVPPELGEGEENAALDQDLLRSPARKIRLAFFPLQEEQATSEYEMTLVFHENGLISDMMIDYDDFSISQKLIALEPLEESCQAIDLND